MSLRRFKTYKNSGIEWVGEIPAHWKIMPLKRDLLFLTSGARGWAEHYSDDGALFIRIGNLTRNRIHLDLGDLQRVTVPSGAEVERTRVAIGDILFSITAYLGSVAVVSASLETAYVSQHVALARLRGRHFFPEWVAYTVLSSMGKTYLETQGYGGTKIQLSLDDVANLIMTGPTLKEQSVLIAFLNRETARIDALVDEQRRLIELLKEKRQAVISHAVTKGLDPNAPMKASGVEWIGDVPMQWDVVPLGKCSIDWCDGPFGSGLKSEHYTDSGIRVVRLQNIRSDGFDASDAAYIDVDYYNQSLNGHDVRSGDVLIAGLGDDRNTVGRACVAPIATEPAIVKADCFRFRLDMKRTVPEFVAMVLSAGSSYDAGLLSSGSTRSRIPLSVMATRKIPLPQVDEQRIIVKFLVQERHKFDELASNAEKAIMLLQERRGALISAAVTGKIDVRGFASTKAEAA